MDTERGNSNCTLDKFGHNQIKWQLKNLSRLIVVADMYIVSNLNNLFHVFFFVHALRCFFVQAVSNCPSSLKSGWFWYLLIQFQDYKFHYKFCLQIKFSPFVHFGSLVIWHPNEVGHLVSWIVMYHRFSYITDIYIS